MLKIEKAMSNKNHYSLQNITTISIFTILTKRG